MDDISSVSDREIIEDNLDSFKDHFCKEYTLFQLLKVTRSKDNNSLIIVYNSSDYQEKPITLTISIDDYGRWLDDLVNKWLCKVVDKTIEKLKN